MKSGKLRSAAIWALLLFASRYDRAPTPREYLRIYKELEKMP